MIRLPFLEQFVTSHGAPPTLPPVERPQISEVDDGPLGRGFTVRFAPGQCLPNHRNSARLVITVVQGAGILTLAEDAPHHLTAGDVVRIEPKVIHRLETTTEAMEVYVTLLTACCDCC